MILRVNLSTMTPDEQGFVQDQDRRWLLKLAKNGSASIARVDKAGNVLIEFGNLPAPAIHALKDLLNEVLSQHKPDFSDLSSMEKGFFTK